MNQEKAIAEISEEKTYHITFPTYKRLAILLNDEYRIKMTRLIKEICQEKDIKLITSKTQTDHVHLLITKQAGQLLPQLIQTIKGITTYEFYKHFPDIKIDIGRGKLWARGYYETLIQSDGQLKNTINYINQNHDCYKDEPLN
ncbi:MAG: IS200/IS605 family transposase [Patescibacteria group bacterium]|jgi:putative transposase